jgi:hypothetical protein
MKELWQMNLSQYSGKRIAVVMDVQGRGLVLRGETRTLRSQHHGTTLQVTIASESVSGQPIFYIAESLWRDQIASGESFDCDYCLELASEVVEAA